MKGLLWLLTFSLVLFVVFKARRGPTDDQPYVQAFVSDKVCRPDHKPWTSKGSSALIFVTSAKCAACQASKPFDEQLFDHETGLGIPVFYLIPLGVANDEAAEDLRKSGRMVFRQDLADFGITHLPTFLRVDDQGTIQSIWTGSVSSDQHDAVFASLVLGSSLEGYKTMSEAEAASYWDRPETQVIGLSDIGRRPHMKIIPPDELELRAKYELSKELVTLVDCGTTLLPGTCQNEARMLKKGGFREVFVVGLPVRSNVCAR
jgi:hypothetical protein